MFSLGWLGLLAWRRREAVRAQGNVRELPIGTRGGWEQGFEPGRQQNEAARVGGFSLLDSVVRIGGRAVEVHSGTAPGVLQGDAVLLEFAALEELCLEELGRVDGIVENRVRAGLFVDPIRHGEVAVHVWFDSLLLEKADRLASDGTIFVSSVSLAIGLVLGLEAGRMFGERSWRVGDVRFRDKRFQPHKSEMHLAVADLRFRVTEKGLVGFLQGVLATEPDLGPAAVFVEEVLANDAIGVSDFVDQDAVDALGELDVDDVVLAMSGDIDGAVVRTHPLVR